jgi:hypothetical protein
LLRERAIAVDHSHRLALQAIEAWIDCSNWNWLLRVSRRRQRPNKPNGSNETTKREKEDFSRSRAFDKAISANLWTSLPHLQLRLTVNTRTTNNNQRQL